MRRADRRDSSPAGGNGSRRALGLPLRGIVLTWAVASAGLMAVAYVAIRPGYEATALLKIRSPEPAVYSEGTDPAEFARFMSTQVELVSSPDVLADALARHPELAELPMLQGSKDPEAVVRKGLHVEPRPGTSLFTISLSGGSRDEATALVEAVVESYLKAANVWSNEEANDQLKRLEVEQADLEKERLAKKVRLASMVAKVGHPDQPAGKITLERFGQMIKQLDALQLRLIGIRNKLDETRGRAARASLKTAAPEDETDQVAALQKELASTEAEVKTLREALNTLEAENRAAGNLAFDLDLARAEYDRADRLYQRISDRIKQIKMELRGRERVDRANRATQVSIRADERLKVMAAIPFGVLALLIGGLGLRSALLGRVEGTAAGGE